MIKENTTIEQEKLHGVFIGTVLQHLAHGKLKVYIHGIHPPEFVEKPEMLPTCIQMVAQFGGSHNGNGLFSYPNIGATVLCTFANGDQNLPIMLGSLQGGENAFGQYEFVKKPDEISSERHLVTAGKSHIEMYENGKISAIVFDPIRTEAKVKYDDSIEGQISVDAVESRPICEKVDSEQLSNINCQFVLDNHDSNGTISSSTHWYNPTSIRETISADNGQTIIISSLNGIERNDFQSIAGNNGMVDSNQHHFIENTYTLNKTSLNAVEQLMSPLTSDVSVSYHYGIDGNEYTNIISNIVNSSNYMSKNPAGNIVSTLNCTGECSSTISQSAPFQFSAGGSQSYKFIKSYANAAAGDNKNITLKSTASNILNANDKLEMTLETLSASKLSETDTLLQIMPHTNKHNSSCRFEVKAENGFSANAIYNDIDNMTMNSMTTIIKKDQNSYIDGQTNKTPFLKLYTRNKIEKSINGSVSKDNVECINYMLPADKKIEISIIDNDKKQNCKIILDASGKAQIIASKSIDITAPDITMTGQKLVQNFKSISIKGQNVNILGSSGDCKIKNVSLLRHKHTETQSGDVVKPQPTKTATQSN